MVLVMLESGSTTKHTDRARSNIKTVIFSMAIGKIIWQMDSVYKKIQTVDDMKVNGKTINSTVMVLKFGKMV